MKTIQNSKVGTFAEKLKDFRSFSATGINIDNKLYVVKSYETLILSYDIQNKKVVIFDNKRYSSTTTKLQNVLIDAFDLEKSVISREKYEF